MDFELRKMTSADIFPVCTIIKKIGVNEIKGIMNSPEMMKLVTQTSGNKNQAETLGFNFMMDLAIIIVGNLPNCENEIYKFLASMSGKSEKELREISPADFLALVLAVIRHEDFKDFFVRASQSLR